MMRSVIAGGLTLSLLCGCERTSNPSPGASGTPSPSPSAPAPVPSAAPSAVPSVASSVAPVASAAEPATTMPPATELKKLAAGSNAFGFDLYARTAKKPGNVVFAPGSISIAMAMTWPGAKGETAAQIQKVMHFADPSVVASFGQLSRAMNAPTRPIKIRAANRLFGEKTFAFEKPYIDSIGTQFGAPLEPVDFVVGFDASRVRINTWVEEQTEKRIKDLLPTGALDTLTRLVLVNAIYLLADWARPFKKEATFDAQFDLSATVKKQVPTMHISGSYPFAAKDGVKVLEMPYVGEDTAMLFVLPDSKTGLGALESSLSDAKLASLRQALSPTMIDVALPRFELSPESMPLRADLEALGMPLAFDKAKADFTLIGNPPDPKEKLSIHKVFHKAFIKVDEKGTEAAAATAVVIGAKGGAAPAPKPEFRADHPFLFFLIDRGSGLVLFMGRVADPSVTGS